MIPRTLSSGDDCMLTRLKTFITNCRRAKPAIVVA